MSDTFWKKRKMTLGDVQSKIGELKLHKLDMRVDTSVFGEVTMLYSPPSIFQLGMKKSLREFVRWVHTNKPSSVTVKFVAVD